jgi:hypothetical protein
VSPSERAPLTTLGRDFVALVPRDADWALALWELTAETVWQAALRLPSPNAPSQVALRIYELGYQRAHRSHGRAEPHTYLLRHWLGHRIVLLGRADCAHQAVLGLRDASDTFVPICRSTVLPPLRAPSAEPTAEEP